jgi:hypothetical protein
MKENLKKINDLKQIVVNIKLSLILIFIFFGGFSSLYAQSFNLDFLFSPGLTLGTEYTPNSAINDSTDFQFTKYKAQYVHPLKTKLGVKGLDLKNFSFKKLDAKASQIFLNTRFSVIQPTLSQNNYYENIYNGTIGITALTASVRHGIWLYSANMYFSENETTLTESPMPNFLGYIANVRIKSTKFMYFYGMSLAINQGKFFPIPIFGFSAKLAPKLNATLTFPVQSKITYKASKNLKIDLAANFDALNSVYRDGSTFQGNDNSLNYRQLKSYLGISVKLNQNFELNTEAGYSSFKKISAISSDYSQSVDASFYGSISVRYRFGKSVFDNFLSKSK